MLAALGDLVDDIVVRVGGPVNVASDTEAVIERRRGGSAANVAAIAAKLTGSSRFLGQVGDDLLGRALLDDLEAGGVDVGWVRRGGRTGTIVVLVDEHGERTMLTDVGVSRSLSDPEPRWLDGVDVLHVPFYSLVDGSMQETATTMIGWAHDRGIAVSIDVSSTAILQEVGADEARRRLETLQPSAVFANEDEAAVLGIDAAIGSAITFVKQGADPVIVHRPHREPIIVPAVPVEIVVDTTGAGDAFAAGVLTTPDWMTDPEAACGAGHAAAATLLSGRTHRRRE